MAMTYAVLSALAISAVSLLGMFVLFSKEQLHGRKVHILLALAAGAMLGNALLHLAPHALTLEQEAINSGNPPALVEMFNRDDHEAESNRVAERPNFAPHLTEHMHHDHAGHDDHDHTGHDHSEHAADSDAEHEAHASHGHAGLFTCLMLLAGLISFYAFDLLLQRKRSNANRGISSEGWMVLAGDMVENLLDGVVIGTAYLLSIPAGIAATITIFLHEIPLELGDFAVLRHAGFSHRRALLANFLSGVVSVAGVLIAIGIGTRLEGFALYATPLAAGGFLYIAGSILVPKLRSQCCDNKSWHYLVTSLIGVSVMVAILFFE